MLSKFSAEIGVNVSEVLVDKGIKLVPIQGSLLSEIVNASKASLFRPAAFSNINYLPETITTASRGRDVVTKGEKKYEHSTHDTFIENYTKDLSVLVSNHISFSRNVVNKEVTYFKDKVTEALESYKFQQPESIFDITYFKLDELFDSGWLVDELSTYKNARKETFFKALDFSNLLRDNENMEAFISEYILIGNKEEDDSIRRWVTSFGAIKCVNNIANKVNEYELSPCDSIHYSFFNWLFYRNLAIKSDLDVGLSSTELRSIAATNRDYFATKLLFSLEVYAKETRNGTVFCGNQFDKFSVYTDKTIPLCLYEESVAKLGEKNLNLDVIFGYMNSVTVDRYVTVDYLEKNAEDCLTKWKNARTLFLIRKNAEKLTVFKQILRTVFEEQLNNIENEEEKEYVTGNSNHLPKVREEGNKYIDDLCNEDVFDLDCIALELVAKIRFSYSCGYTILKEMTKLLEQDDKLTPTEAATYSVINYVTDFLLDQVNAVR